MQTQTVTHAKAAAAFRAAWTALEAAVGYEAAQEMCNSDSVVDIINTMDGDAE